MVESVEPGSTDTRTLSRSQAATGVTPNPQRGHNSFPSGCAGVSSHSDKSQHLSSCGTSHWTEEGEEGGLEKQCQGEQQEETPSPLEPSVPGAVATLTAYAFDSLSGSVSFPDHSDHVQSVQPGWSLARRPRPQNTTTR
ncbi:hypothetical protein AGIG_G20119 [Arapaima gigas]